MKESRIEAKPIALVDGEGGYYIKMSPQWMAGIPDRLLLLPNATISFIEIKKPDGTFRPKQPRVAEKLKKLGFLVYVAYGVDDLRTIVITEIMRSHARAKKQRAR